LKDTGTLPRSVVFGLAVSSSCLSHHPESCPVSLWFCGRWNSLCSPLKRAPRTVQGLRANQFFPLSGVYVLFFFFLDPKILFSPRQILRIPSGRAATDHRQLVVLCYRFFLNPFREVRHSACVFFSPLIGHQFW